MQNTKIKQTNIKEQNNTNKKDPLFYLVLITHPSPPIHTHQLEAISARHRRLRTKGVAISVSTDEDHDHVVYDVISEQRLECAVRLEFLLCVHWHQ